MKGVCVRKIKLVHEDERRKLMEIMNGDMDIRNLKILHVKKGDQILGNHWHTYGEVRYLLQGHVSYRLKHVLTGEEMEFEMEAGDVFLSTGFVVHSGDFTEDSIMIDGAAESYIDADFNDIQEKLL